MFDPNPNPENGIVDNAGLAYLVSVQASLPLAMFIVNQTTGATYTTEVVAGVMTVVQTGGAGTVVVPPNSPTLYVSNAGSDAITQPGTLALPLLTVQEAARRHRSSGATGYPVIVLVNTINLGADPLVDLSPTPGGGIIVLETTYQNDVTGVAVTGGTALVQVGVTLGTLTTANAQAANQHQGKILQFTAGPLSGRRFVVDANDNIGGFTLTGPLSAPSALNVFNIVSRLGKLTWTGNFTCAGTGAFIFDGVELAPTVANSLFTLLAGATLFETATRWVTAAAFQIANMGNWQSSTAKGSTQFGSLVGTIPLPTGVTLCPCRYEGASGVIAIGGGPQWGSPIGFGSFAAEGVSMQGVSLYAGQYWGGASHGTAAMFEIAGFSSLTDCGAWGIGPGTSLVIISARITSGRSVSGGPVGVISGSDCARIGVNNVNFASTVTGDCVLLTQGALALLTLCVGAAPAGKFFLNVLIGSTAVTITGQSNTATGGTPGSDIQVDGGVAFAVALFATFGVIGAQNGSFQHSTSDLTANPTINKLSGFGSIATGGPTTSVITNSLAAAGDHVRLTPTSINATVAKWSAVATLNTITITVDAAPTVAAWTFSWELLKSTV